MKRPGAALCSCGHERYEHQFVEDVGGGKVKLRAAACSHHTPYDGPCCICTRFQRAGSPTKREARKNYHQGSGFEHDTADAFSGIRMGRRGDVDVVVYGSDEAELLAIECEETKATGVPKARAEKWEQAKRMSRGRKGAPLPMLCFRQKQGRGHPSDAWCLMKRDDLVTLLERLGATGE